MEGDIQLKVMIQPELKAEAAKAAVLDPYAESLSHFVRIAIAEKIDRSKREQKLNG